MAEITGAPPFMAGGKTTSGGPKTDIYRVKVVNVVEGVSSNAGTPFIELELQSHKDADHKEREGKTLIKQRFYGANPNKSEEDQQAALGRLKNQLFKPLEVSWPKENKRIEPRLFMGKEFFVLIAMGKPNGEYDARAEVKRIAKERSKLEKALETALGNVAQAENDDGEGSTETESKPSKRAAGR